MSSSRLENGDWVPRAGTGALPVYKPFSVTCCPREQLPRTTSKMHERGRGCFLPMMPVDSRETQCVPGHCPCSLQGSQEGHCVSWVAVSPNLHRTLRGGSVCLPKSLWNL